MQMSHPPSPTSTSRRTTPSVYNTPSENELSCRMLKFVEPEGYTERTGLLWATFVRRLLRTISAVVPFCKKPLHVSRLHKYEGFLWLKPWTTTLHIPNIQVIYGWFADSASKKLMPNARWKSFNVCNTSYYGITVVLWRYQVLVDASDGRGTIVISFESLLRLNGSIFCVEEIINCNKIRRFLLTGWRRVISYYIGVVGTHFRSCAS